MDTLNSGLLQLNLAPEIIDNIYTIIYGDVEDPNATIYSNYQILSNYKANYLLYNNGIGLLAVATISDKTTRVLNYIDNLLTQLKSEPDFWEKLAVSIRKERKIFNPKIVRKYEVDGDGIIIAITTEFARDQDYRVYDINAVNSLTGGSVLKSKEVEQIRRGSRVSSLKYKPKLVGYLDPTSLGGVDGIVAYSDLVVDEEEGTVTERIKFKAVTNKAKNIELLKRNGYYFKSELKLLLEPDFLSKTFKGGLYMKVEKVGYKLMANFEENKQ